MNRWLFCLLFVFIGLTCIVTPIILILLYTVQNAPEKNPQLINRLDIKWRMVNEIWPTHSDLIKDCDLLGDSRHTCMKFPEEHQFYKLKLDSHMYTHMYIYLFLYATSTQPHITLLIYDDDNDNDEKRIWHPVILEQVKSLVKANEHVWYVETQARVQPNEKHWTTGIRDLIDAYILLYYPTNAMIKSWYHIGKEKWQEIKMLPEPSNDEEKIYRVDQVPKIYHAWFLKAHFGNKIQIVTSMNFSTFQTFYDIF